MTYQAVEKFRNKSVWIVGLGREGLSSYHFLRQQLPELKLTIVDEKPLSKLVHEWSDFLETDQLLHYHRVDFANDSEVIDQAQIAVRSPGIPVDKIVKKFQLSPDQITSNTKLLFEVVAELKKAGQEITTIGVTGTKGKSTTTAMIHHVLDQSGLESVLGGNIGLPPLEMLKKVKPDSGPTHLVLELSSHQLSDAIISPSIAVVQEVEPTHLDYYGIFSNYLEAKKHIIAFQTDKDITIYNYDSKTATDLADSSKGKKVAFSLETNPEESENSPVIAWIDQGQVWYDSEAVMKVHQVKLAGTHNLNNVLPAVIIAKQLKISNQKIAAAVGSFKGLPHRLELVTEKNGVKYYNDSLATNPKATIAALESFDQPTILIAGGCDRGDDYQSLAKKLLETGLKALILIKPSGQNIENELNKLSNSGNIPFPINYAKSMEEAISISLKSSAPGDIVLMSPASASFGLFKDYADRGDQFRAAIRLLVK